MITQLTVLYDADCPTCRHARAWIEQQVALVPIEFVAAGSDEARRRFPGLDHERTMRDVTAVGDDGSVYHHDRAWIVVLWCLARWRDVAEHFATPVRRPLLKVVVNGTDRWRRARKRRLYPAGRADAPLPPPIGLPPPVIGARCDDRCEPGRGIAPGGGHVESAWPGRG